MNALLLISGVLAVAVPGLVWQVRHAVRAGRARRYVAPPPRLIVRPRRETEPGINLALRDECELLWAVPAYGTTTPDQPITTTEGD
ncbi:hypothetical protein [Streptomyces sp. BBFR109]|uniref:hypothetical protein n=1 Tax=Streptomyces sp. BBFR109 TaxID=3448172 RepID=UPI003F7763FB